MRKIFFLFLVVVIPFQLFSQNIKGGLIFGINASQVDGDQCIGYNKAGFNVGAEAIVPFKKNFSFTIETIFNQKGSHQRAQFVDSLDGEYKLILNYLEVPVLFHYTDKDVVSIGTGFSWGRLVQYKEWQDDFRMNPDSVPAFKKNDINIILDAQIKITKGFYFDLRYAYSVAKIRTREFHNYLGSWSRNQYNNLLSFRLIYIFKDKPGPKKNKNPDNKTK